MTFLQCTAAELPGVKIQQGVMLEKYTTIRVGGPADFWAEPESEEQLIQLIRIAEKTATPVMILGNGSNLLVKDGGLRGLVIRLGRNFSRIERTEKGLRAQSGALMSSLARAALDASLTGLEFAQGIPGAVGGGAYMNAGAYGGEISQTAESIRVLTKEGIREVSAEEMAFGYRHTEAMKNGWVILSVSFALEKGDPKEIAEKMQDYAARRKSKQPLEYPSAGSFFKRPEGHFAGALIEQAGLKGLTVGGAQVSRKHAGFLINIGGATAADFLALMAKIQQAVMEKFGVKLENEVRIVGSDQ